MFLLLIVYLGIISCISTVDTCWSGGVCPQNFCVIKDECGTIKSPNFPQTFGDNERYDWEIYFNTSLKLRFDYFFLGESNCGDYVEVIDGAKTLGKGCGSQFHGRTFIGQSGTLHIKFQTDGSNDFVTHAGDGTDKGFRASFHDSCLQRTSYPITDIISKDHGEILSPCYPSAYGPNVDFQWIINSPGRNILLHFRNFRIQYSDYCVYDYVQIKDGGRLLGKGCGTEFNGRMFTARSGSMIIKFISDAGFNYYSGFNATFTTLQV